MTIEASIYTVLAAITPRVFPDVAPIDTPTPFVTYQQVGGKPANFVSGIPSMRNGHFQINVWSATRAEAASLARQIEDAARLNSTLSAVTLGGVVSTYEPETKLYGTRQDFSIWFFA